MTHDLPARGLQRERTALAWDRTGLALIATGLLLVRVAGPPYIGWVHAPGLAATLVGSALVLHAARRYASRRAGRTAEPGLTRLVGITATLVCAFALVVVLTR